MSRGLRKLVVNALGALIGVAVLALFLNGVGALASRAEATPSAAYDRRSYDPAFGVVCYRATGYNALSCVQVRNGTRNLSGE